MPQAITEVWLLESETSNIGYLDPLGCVPATQRALSRSLLGGSWDSVTTQNWACTPTDTPPWTGLVQVPPTISRVRSPVLLRCEVHDPTSLWWYSGFL